MKETIAIKESSIIYGKINELHLTESQRQEAFGALETAESVCDTLAWIFIKLGQIGDWLTPNSALKHQ